jgi:hypothetical protein
MSDELPLNDDRIEFPEGSAGWKREQCKKFHQLSKKHGGLTTPWLASLVLCLSHQRIAQLVAAGRIPSYDILGKKMIPCDHLEHFAALERSPGYRYAAPLAHA